MKPGATTSPEASMTRVAGAVIDGCDPHDRVAADPDIAAVPRAAGAVDDAPAAEDEIVSWRLRRNDGREEKQQREQPGASHIVRRSWR